MPNVEWENTYRFEESSQFGGTYFELVCQTPPLQAIAKGFTRNMNRVAAMGMLPINLTSIAIINESARVEALVNKCIPLHDPRTIYGHPKFDPQLFDEINDERKRLIEEWKKSWPNFHIKVWKIGVEGANTAIDANPNEAGIAVQATMAAMLIGLWTAFESAAQDAWILAVNTHPKPLADRVLKTMGKEEQQKFLSGKIVSDAGYDLRNCMGDVLVRKRAVDFQVLGSIRDAYKVAFESQFEAIFEEYQVELSRLEAVRNLFVHKGGLIDRKFVERMGNEPQIKETIGRSLTVKGDYVAQKANMVADCSTQLIQAVDKWLLDNLVGAQT